ncbi:penicillin-binding protein 2 [Brackiella oedipodis]|uniref:penicillin-binding protein 2 n=1 Tax=Brackiella oedipodis TaxID=124225 RepID=UPI0009FCF28F|nr:penicillin-binding protein 2 [Brackiella oedipodis]
MFNFNKSNLQERVNFGFRIVVASIIILSCFGILIYRLYVLQVERFQGLSERSDHNRISLVPIVPKRGNIYDRNGEILARSYRDYILEITPGQVEDIDGTIDKLKTIMPLSDWDIKRFRRRMNATTRFASVTLRSNLTDEEAAFFAARSFEFPGVNLRARWVREYPQQETAAHLVGYVGRISAKDQENLEKNGEEGNYRGTDTIGKKGLELSYEKQLHGQTGWEEVEIAASGRPVRVLKRIDPIPGDDLHLSIDLGLQRKAEAIYNNPKNPQRGALVAIDPRNGQVLAYVSAPSYDPNLFVDGIDVENWRRLADSPDHPLLDRPISGAFPVGSVYKPFVALAALKYKVRDPNARVPDPGYFEYGGQKFRNAGHAVYGPTNMHKALVVSSDTYFFGLGPLIGVDRLHDFATQFGFGKKTGIDLNHEQVGVLPSTDWKRHAFKNPKQQTWFKGETISVAVGQGYNAFTIMQLAQGIATLANDGIYTRPHLVNSLVNSVLNKDEKVVKKPEYKVDIDDASINIVKKALAEVTVRGTSRRAFAGAQYHSAGKTGTAQVFSLKGARYNAASLNKRLHDHALYIGYAPAENPKIAIALIVENGGWGATVAAPVARTLFDYWLVNKNNNNDTETDGSPNNLFVDLPESEQEQSDQALPDIDAIDVPGIAEADSKLNEPLPEILDDPKNNTQPQVPAHTENDPLKSTRMQKQEGETGIMHWFYGLFRAVKEKSNNSKEETWP